MKFNRTQISAEASEMQRTQNYVHNNCLLFAPVYVNELPIEVVPSVKILGLRISKDLKWNAHIFDIFRQGFYKIVFPWPN